VVRTVFDTPLGQALLADLQKAADQRKEQQDNAAQARRPTSRGMYGRQYSAAKASRLAGDWNPATTSADAEIANSSRMRDRSRALVRDGSYAKRAKVIVQNNVVGNGVGLQAQVKTSRDSFNDRVNQETEELWEEWSYAENCHTGGRLAFSHLERNLIGQVFEAGDVLVRKHYTSFGRSGIPFALELIEAERIASDIANTETALAAGNEIRMGCEVDRFQRPVAWYIRQRHPGEIRFSGNARDKIERVPAELIIPLFVVDRWPQTRGVPWMSAAMRRMNDMDGYSEAEIIRARIQATSVGAIESPEGASDFAEEQDDGSFELETEPGVYHRLNPGEKLNAQAPTAPNPALDPFMRYMLREVAAGIGVSYASLSMDYSQSNYSSSRLALLDDRDLWRVIQGWFVCDFRSIVHREWLQAAVLSGKLKSVSPFEYALNPRKFEAARFKTRGWSWIDPKSEISSFIDAVNAGFTTVSDVVAKNSDGRDIEDVLEERERELEMMKEKKLVFTTSPEIYGAAAKKDQAAAKQSAEPPDDKPPDAGDQSTETPPARGFSSLRVAK
jgi:lambda family phage portal protein